MANATSPSAHSASLLFEQQLAAGLDGGLCDLRKALQQPRQRDLDIDAVVQHVDMAGCRLAHGADAECQTVAVPAFVVDLDHREACRRACQPAFQPADRFVAAKGMRKRDSKRGRHGEHPLCGEPTLTLNRAGSSRPVSSMELWRGMCVFIAVTRTTG